jgi:ATP-dependent protease Clp ATPase subunit
MGELYCSFCDKSQRKVEFLVKGPGTVNICSECTEICVLMLDEHRKRPKRVRYHQDMITTVANYRIVDLYS